ncbi:MAG: hypothetical protein SGILL_005319 [Bacillariaceae sp.]
MTSSTAKCHTVEEILGLAASAGPAMTAKDAADKIRRGLVVMSPMTSLSERQLAAGFAFLLDPKITAQDVKQIFLESEEKEESDDTIQQMVRMEDDGSLDFSSVKLLPSKTAHKQTQAYIHNKPGDNLNLSKEERSMFHGKSTQEAVEDTLRRVLQQRLDTYRQRGLEGIAPYERKGGKEYSPGKELKEVTEQLGMLQQIAPDFAQYLVDYPNHKPANVEDTFGWINFNINDQPTIALFHKSYLQISNTCAAMCFRHFYVSQGHNSVQNVGGCFPVMVESTERAMMINSSRTSTDQVAGFGGAAKKSMGSRVMGGKIKANYEKYLAVLEKAAADKKQ